MPHPMEIKMNESYMIYAGHARYNLYHRTLLAFKSSYAPSVIYLPFFIAAFVTRRITLQMRWQPDPIKKMIIIFIFYHSNVSTFKINVER